MVCGIKKAKPGKGSGVVTTQFYLHVHLKNRKGRSIQPADKRRILLGSSFQQKQKENENGENLFHKILTGTVADRINGCFEVQVLCFIGDALNGQRFSKIQIIFTDFSGSPGES